jgi:hypothetical protein
MNVSYHYITLAPEKILKQIEEKEQIVIKEYYEYGMGNTFEHPTIEDVLGKIVVMSGKHLVSVYPIITPYQGDRMTWVRFDKRNIIYKHGWIVVCYAGDIKKDGFEDESENDDKGEAGFLIELQIRGNTIALVDMYGDDIPKGVMESTLEDYMPQTIRQAISQLKVKEQLESLSFDIPMFLPPAWEEIWTVEKRTRFVTFCK